MGGGPNAPRHDDASEADPAGKTFNVVVTGMGIYPGADGNEPENSNTAHLICNILPTHLAPSSAFNPSSARINIINPTAGDGNGVPTSYRHVRTNLPSLWARYGNSVDMILHLGIAIGWNHLSCERAAWKEGTKRPGPRVNPGDPYTKPGAPDLDNDHEWPDLTYYTMPDSYNENINDLKGANLHPWTDFPDKLLVPGFDIDGTVDEVNTIIDREINRKQQRPLTHLPQADTSTDVVHKPIMLPHSEPGFHLCGFITYESLAIKRRGAYKALTGFCHVPGWMGERDLENMRDTILAFIGVVMSKLEKGERVE